MRTLPLLLLVAVTTSVAAKPSDDAFVRYRRALKAGRKLEAKHDLAGATTSFAEALAARPNDGVAQSELGWVAFQQKDLDKAEQLTQKAIAALDDPHMLGASYYNLGRVHEARNKRDAAIAAYKTSLEKRPNHIVRERLAKLDPEAAAAADPATPKPLKGPFKTFAEACRTLNEGAEGECQPQKTIDTPAAPWKAIKVVTHGESEELTLVVQTAAGWFVSPDLAECSYEELRESCKVEQLNVANLVGGPAPELRFAYVESMEYRISEDSDDGEALHPLVSDDTHNLLVCGVGTSGKPSCTGQLTTGVSSAGGANLSKMEFAFEATFTGDQVELKPKSGKAPGDFKDVLGTHRIIFP